MTIPYSSYQVPFLGEIRDIALNNVQNEDILQYDNLTRTWKNVVNTGASITGSDDAALFKSGDGVGEGDSAGITRDPTSSGYTINLDTTNKYVGINKVNPAYELDVDGKCLIGPLEISANQIGNITPDTNLQLFSHNQPDKPLRINSNRDLVDIGGFRTKEPVAVDTIYPSVRDCFYKLQLGLGIDKWSGVPFDTQEDYANTLGFPTSQIVEYQNEAPITGARIIGRFNTPTDIDVGATLDVLYFGNQNATPLDICVYDPMQMRTRKSGTDWIYAGAPSVWRQSNKKLIFKVNWFIAGTYAGNPANGNQFTIYLRQHRNSAILREFRIYNSPGREKTPRHGGSRTMLTHTTAYNEDFDPSTDDWSMYIENNADGTHILTLDSFNAEIECFLAQ